MTLAVPEQPPLPDQMRFAEALSQANLLPAAYQRQPANVLLALQMGYALGLPAAEAINSINVIKGKPTMSADLMAALIRRAGHRMRVKETATSDGPSVTVQIIRSDDPEFTFEVTWDRAKAKQAGLGGDNWRKYEGQMMRARAITECARQACSDVLHGVIYDPTELAESDAKPQPAERVTVLRAQPAELAEVLADEEPPALDDTVESRAVADAPWIDRLERVESADEAVALWREARTAGASAEVLERITTRGQEMRTIEATKTAADELGAEVIDGEVID